MAGGLLRGGDLGAALGGHEGHQSADHQGQGCYLGDHLGQAALHHSCHVRPDVVISGHGASGPMAQAH
ncbi:hypothetical protein ACFFX0_26765 [Citricoccus parietis]|uniref:Uncharacterized protein n=1 Tax=Citricoccus parietis TaxID=592307 RepID=A0ABV5G6M5_9MICC